jgi:hypothetical protein
MAGTGRIDRPTVASSPGLRSSDRPTFAFSPTESTGDAEQRVERGLAAHRLAIDRRRRPEHGARATHLTPVRERYPDVAAEQDRMCRGVRAATLAELMRLTEPSRGFRR